MGDDTKADSKVGDKRRSETIFGLRRVMDALLAIVSVFVLGWGAFVFAKATDAERVNLQQEERIKILERQADKFERKLDEILYELRKRP